MEAAVLSTERKLEAQAARLLLSSSCIRCQGAWLGRLAWVGAASLGENSEASEDCYQLVGQDSRYHQLAP